MSKINLDELTEEQLAAALNAKRKQKETAHPVTGIG